MSINRRQFERLNLSEDAVALDQAGRKLGKVSSAGGGGFLIYPASPDATGTLAPGKRLTITVHEPKQNVNSTVDVEVRYRDGEAVGVEFVGGEGVAKK